MFRAHVLIIRRSKLHYTASGIITHIGGRLRCVYIMRINKDAIRHYTLSFVTRLNSCNKEMFTGGFYY